MPDRPNNRDIVVFALATLGGESSFVHTEDIAVECHKLAPDAFSWKKYSEYPDLEVARRTLGNLKKSEFGSLVEGSSGEGSRKKDTRSEDGWRLMPAGREWVSANGDAVEAALNSTDLSDRRQRVRLQLRRVYRHPLWAEFNDAPGEFAPSLGDLAELVRVRVDAPGEIWDSRFDELDGRADVVEDDSLVVFAQQCRSAYERRR